MFSACSIEKCGMAPIQKTTSIPSANEVMDWAQEYHSALFPGTPANQVSGPLVYRHYPASGYYLGVVNGHPGIMGIGALVPTYAVLGVCYLLGGLLFGIATVARKRADVDDQPRRRPFDRDGRR